MSNSPPSPRPDPVPGPRQTALRRFWRIVRLLSLFAALIALAAVLLVTRGDEGMHVHMLVATALGTWLMIMVGAVLMTLVFVSASSGHDDEASKTPDKGD